MSSRVTTIMELLGLALLVAAAAVWAGLAAALAAGAASCFAVSWAVARAKRSQR